MTQLKQKGDLFSVKAKKDGKDSKKKAKKQKGGKEINVKKAEKPDYLPGIDAQPLTYKTLTVGQVLLGCISEVRNYELVVSLPHKLVGSVSLAHISRPYTALFSKLKDDDDGDEEEIHALQELYQPGQYVVVSVVSIEKINSRTKVSLTLMPNEVNFGISASSLEKGLVLPCAVASVEDKGYALDTGIAGIKAAFLKKVDKSRTLALGSVLRCVITNVFGSDTEDNLRLTLSADPEAVSSATLDPSDTANMALLLPGTAVRTTISKIQRDALVLMLAGVDGIVCPLHLAQPFEQLKQYSVGASVLARVLYVTPLSKVVHFTLQESVCCKSSVTDPLGGLRIGDIIWQAEIYVTSSSGVYVKLNSKSRGFCSGNHLSDKNKVLKHISRDFPAGKKIPSRLIKYNHMDQLFIVSLQRSILEQQFVTYGEVEPGQIVKATVTGYDDAGATVALSKRISGRVPLLHLTAKARKHPEHRTAVGEPVTARVLKVDAERRHLLLTLKPRLVTAKEPILAEYTTEAENTVTVGYVIKVMPMGLLVGMFGDVKGFVPKSKTGVEDFGTAFREGQVVRCRVLKVHPERKNITLSLHVDDDTKPLKKKEPKSVDNVEMRSRVKCVVNKVNADAIRVSISPQNTKAVIPVQHLSDNVNKCQLIRELVREKDEIVNAVVFSKAADSITLTLKPSVNFWIDQASSEAQQSQDLLPEETYPAVVSNIRSYGLFVAIPSGSSGSRGLVHVRNIPGKWTDTTELDVCVGQSLDVSFKERDEKGRPVLTSVVKVNVRNATRSSLRLLYTYLKDEEVVSEALLKRGGQEGQFAKFGVGEKVVAVVTDITPEEVHVRVKNGTVTGTVPSGHQHKRDALKVGQKVKACVLRANQEDKSLEVTLRPSLRLNMHLNKTENLKIGMKVRCEIVLAKDSFTMVVMKSECKGTVAYLPSLTHANNRSGASLGAVGSKRWVVVKHVEGPLVLGVLKCHDDGEELNLTSKLPEIIFTPQGGETDSEENGEETLQEDVDDLNVASERPLNASVCQVEGEAREISKKRQLEGKEAKKSKKAKTGKTSSTEQAKDNGLSHDDALTSHMNEEEEDGSECGGKEDESESPSAKPCLTLTTGFVWDVPDVTQDPDLDESSDSDGEELPKLKKVKQQRKASFAAAAQEEERRLHQLELSRLEESQTPQSALEFEALLQKSPNSSAVWIQFISFHLESAEVDKAKAVARRALQDIDTQEEEERLNIWTVLLRLEVLYGSPDTVAEAYKEALVTTDQLKAHFAMAMVYAESNKIKEAEKVYFNMTKKFSKELMVWVKAGIFFFSHNMAKEGRHYFDRALHSLDKKDHVELINRFGQLEFRFGEAERGRTMFESLLSTYWKRLDVWSVYVDLLAKRKDTEGARHVLERMAGLKLRVRKMRFVFKKFLDFEKEHGTPQSLAAVKQRVEEFVSATLQ